jgi:uncharacterized protein YjaZ
VEQLGVVNTKAWLEECEHHPLKLCEKLTCYFKGFTEKEIYEYLCLFGMYKPSIFGMVRDGDSFIKSDHWKSVEKEFATLRAKWKGPDVPILILPVNQRNPQIMKKYKGKSGLAFPDKLFLFLAPEVEQNEIKALLTHEYHHVCRLSYMKKKEEEINLLDTILLEGMAEHAVKEECGKEYVSYWTELYSQKELRKWWIELIYPNRNKMKNEKEFQELLYGQKNYPNMLGYCIGYYLIDICMQKKQYSLKVLEKLNMEIICKLLPVKS